MASTTTAVPQNPNAASTASFVAKQSKRVAGSFVRFVRGETSDLFFGFVWITVFVLIAFVLGLVANVSGYPRVNIAFEYLFVGAAIIAAYYPEHFVWFAIFKKSGLYWDIIKGILMGGSVIFFYLAKVPFSENPLAFFSIIAAIIPITLMANRWKDVVGGTLGIEITFWGFCVMLGIDFISLFPIEFWGGKGSTLGDFIEGNLHREGMPLFILTMLTFYIVAGLRFAKAKKEKEGVFIYWVVFAAAGVLSMLVFSSSKDPVDHHSKGAAHISHVATPAIVPAALPQPVHVATLHDAKEIDLSYDWTPELQLTPGVKAVTWCSGPGAEMRMFFDGGVSQYTSGVVLTCRNAGDAYENRWDGLRNVRIQFHCAKNTEQAVCDNLKVTKASFY